MQKMDALYAEAERVYRKYLAEDVRVARAGGADKLSKGYIATVGNQEILDEIAEANRELKQKRREVRGGEFRLVWIHRKPGVTIEGSIVTLVACIDAHDIKRYQAGVYVGDGKIVQETTYYTNYEPNLKISSFSSQDVKTCA